MIGDLQYIRAHRRAALRTHHTYQTDLMRYYTDDSSVSWVLGWIDRTESFLSEELASEAQALGFVQSENRVGGVIEAGQFQPAQTNHLMP